MSVSGNGEDQAKGEPPEPDEKTAADSEQPKETRNAWQDKKLSIMAGKLKNRLDLTNEQAGVLAKIVLRYKNEIRSRIMELISKGVSGRELRGNDELKKIFEKAVSSADVVLDDDKLIKFKNGLYHATRKAIRTGGRGE
ncbi:MAG: hypothetical protein GXP32_06070 [Kiritimatiellaeota bacterium]|nr:hypothetical protein [Kiritimatiellota bacterium]